MKSNLDFKFDGELSACPICLSGSISYSYTTIHAPLCLPGFRVWCCRDCGVRFVNPQPCHTSLKEFYESPEFQEINYSINATRLEYISDPRKKALYEDQVALLRHHKGSGRVLDIGCGVGEFVRVSTDYGYDAEGIDLAADRIKFGQAHLGLDDRIKVSSFEEFMPAARYDFVTCWDIIEHVKNPKLMMQSIKGFLNSGGIAVIRIPITDGIMFDEEHPETWKWVMAPYHLFQFSNKTFEWLMHTCGYQVIGHQFAKDANYTRASFFRSVPQFHRTVESKIILRALVALLLERSGVATTIISLLGKGNVATFVVRVNASVA